jgi:hypothetical protein
MRGASTDDTGETAEVLEGMAKKTSASFERSHAEKTSERQRSQGKGNLELHLGRFIQKGSMSETENETQPELEWVAIVARISGPQGQKWNKRTKRIEQTYLLEPIGTVAQPVKQKAEKESSGRLF